MTHQDLHDLLHDQVDDLEAPDLTTSVWREAVRRRRRGRLATAGVTVLATALVVAGVAVVRDRTHPGSDRRPEPAGPPPWVTETAQASSAGDAEFQDIPVWWSPDLDEELDLPWVGASPLPRELDLTAAAPDVAEAPIDRALAAFAGPGSRVVDTVVLLGEDWELRRLDVSRLQPWDDPDGNPNAVATGSMLSPDGRRLVFPQAGHLMVFDLSTNDWSRIDAGDAETAHVRWQLDDLVMLPETGATAGPLFTMAGEPGGPGAAPREFADLPEGLRNPYGVWRVNGDSEHAEIAQSWGMGPPIPVRDPAAYLSAPASLVVTGGPGGTSILAFMTGIDDYRFMDAPPAAGWLNDDTVVYESVAEDRDLLIAWDVDTSTFRRVMSVTPGWLSSFARLS